MASASASVAWSRRANRSLLPLSFCQRSRATDTAASSDEPITRKRRSSVRCLEPDPITGPIVTETYRRAARDGIAAAARYLGRSTSDTRRLLSNRVYLGEVRHATAGRNLDAHEPLADLGTWTAAQIKPRRRAQSVAYPLSGIARCAGCGGPLTGQLSKDREGRRGRRYRCSRRHSDACVSISADVLEAHTRRGHRRRSRQTAPGRLARRPRAGGRRGGPPGRGGDPERVRRGHRAASGPRDRGLPRRRPRAQGRGPSGAPGLSRGVGAGQRDRDTTGRRRARRRPATHSSARGDGRRDRGQWRAQGRRGSRPRPLGDPQSRLNRVPALDSLSERGYARCRLLEANRRPPRDLRAAATRTATTATRPSCITPSRRSNTRHLPSGRIRAPDSPAAPMLSV